MENTCTKQIKAQFLFHTNLFKNVLLDISDEESNIQVQSNLNPIKWVAGHVINTRLVMMQAITGQGADVKYSKLFGRGSSNIIDPNVPTIAEILEKWEEVSSNINFIDNLTNAFLLSKTNFQTPIPDTTNLGFLAFIASHESMHIGQLSILRKLLNKEAMSLKSS